MNSLGFTTVHMYVWMYACTYLCFYVTCVLCDFVYCKTENFHVQAVYQNLVMLEMFDRPQLCVFSASCILNKFEL